MNILKAIWKTYKELRADKREARLEVDHFKEQVKRWKKRYDSLIILSKCLNDLALYVPSGIGWYSMELEIQDIINNPKRLKGGKVVTQGFYVHDEYSCLAKIYYKTYKTYKSILKEMKKAYRRKDYELVHRMYKNGENEVKQYLKSFNI